MGNCSSAKIDETDPKSLILTESEILLIKKSWKLVVTGGLSKYGTNMMIKIFIEHKDLKPLWRFAKNLETVDQMNGNQMLKKHGEKLFNALDMAIGSLNDLETLVPILIQLGYSHYTWGIRDTHFGVIGEALIGTLEDGLKDEFNPKVKKAWIKVFGVVESQMKIGMRQAESEAQAPKRIEITTVNENGNYSNLQLKEDLIDETKYN